MSSTVFNSLLTEPLLINRLLIVNFVNKKMKQQFYIEGMTCQNCRKGILEKLQTLSNSSEIQVSLETGEASIVTDQTIPLKDISTLLGSKYTVTENISSISSESKLKALYPLFLIFGYIILGTLFLSYITSATTEKTMHYFMGLFFIVFSFFKFLDYKGFPDSFARYDPLAKRSQLYAKSYPFIESVLGVAFMFSWQLPLILGITLLILSLTTYGVLKSLINKSEIQCACLGTALNLPMTEATLIENGIMIIMSLMLLMEYIL